MKMTKILQNSENFFACSHILTVDDCDLEAIKMMNSGIIISEKDVDEYVSHVLTYIHKDLIPNVKYEMEHLDKINNHVWMYLRNHKFDERDTWQYVTDCILKVKDIVKAYDDDLFKKCFSSKMIQTKYHLGTGLKVTKDTFDFVNSLKLGKKPNPKLKKHIEECKKKEAEEQKKLEKKALREAKKSKKTK